MFKFICNILRLRGHENWNLVQLPIHKVFRIEPNPDKTSSMPDRLMGVYMTLSTHNKKEIEDWCKVHIRSSWKFRPVGKLWFRKKSDAVLFKLRWM